ncbi:MAG: HEAT repeat domain-containing protein [candidate division WOR-3 bacterium]|nr:MAG: HEAT repeat domain-containing protein [candidate division WOR-3 bacterium]
MKDEVDQIILGLTKSFKAMQMYGMSHSSFLNFFEPFYQKLSTFLREHNELHLKIEKFKMIYAERDVYKEEEMDMSIAFRLFKDGIRSIGFQSGLTSDELLLFIDVISQPSKDWDVALGLWECNFTHVTFYVIETEEVLDYKVPDVPVEQIDYDEKLRQLLLKEKIDIDAIIIPDLNDREVENLKKCISDEEKSAILPIVIRTLSDYLRIERSEEIIDGLIEILETSVNMKDFYNARRISYKLKDYPDVDFIGRFENEVAIEGFREMLNVPEDERFNEFLAFLGFFRKKSIPYIIRLIPFVERTDRLNALRHRVAHIADNDAGPVAAFVTHENADIQLNAVQIIGIMKPAGMDKLFQPLLHHSDERIRMAIVDAISDVKHVELAAKYISDPSVEVRIKSLRILGKFKYPGIYTALLERIKRRDFLDLDFTEQREVFNNLTANRDSGVVQLMRNLLYKRKWFGHKKYRVMRRLAALALSQIDTDESREVLKLGAQMRNRDIKLACETVLKERST